MNLKYRTRDMVRIRNHRQITRRLLSFSVIVKNDNKDDKNYIFLIYDNFLTLKFRRSAYERSF